MPGSTSTVSPGRASASAARIDPPLRTTCLRASAAVAKQSAAMAAEAAPIRAIMAPSLAAANRTPADAIERDGGTIAGEAPSRREDRDASAPRCSRDADRSVVSLRREDALLAYRRRRFPAQAVALRQDRRRLFLQRVLLLHARERGHAHGRAHPFRGARAHGG